MEYVVLRPHVFRDERGLPLPKAPGDLIQVASRRIAKALLHQGVIRLNNLPEHKRKSTERADSFTRAFRVGCFMHTSKFYSGGRVHLFQMLWTMADMGAEVYLVTDNAPRWLHDYPTQKRLHVVNYTDRRAPDDIDVLLTDGKGQVIPHVLEWKRNNPNAPLVCLNFETPNWVKHYAPECADKMPEMRACYEHADVLLANSEESLKWLREFMPVKVMTGIVPPAANTFALDHAVEDPLPEAARGVPYVVWSSRGSAYKGGEVVCSAVLAYPKPLNLALIGQPSHLPQNTDLHRFVRWSDPLNDLQKMALMRGAVCVAAPSRFEGYGMVPGEALCNGTPVVVYDLPVLRQNYGDRLVYAKWNDPEDFARKLRETIERRPKVDAQEARRTYGMEAMKDRVLSVPYFNFQAKRVSAQMILYYGPTVQEAIESVYPHVDEVIVAYGPTELWKDVPADDSRERLAAVPDPDKKIRVLEQDAPWENKQVMRQACQRRMTGNYVLIVDADEIYHELGAWIQKAPDYGCPRWVHFWHDLEHYVVDTPGMDRWGDPHPAGGGTHNHFRWAYWRYTNEWTSTRGTVAMDKWGTRLSSAYHTRLATQACPECCIYHLGHVLDPDLMMAKHRYYLKRDGDEPERVRRMKVWHEWRGQLGNCGDGDIRLVTWELPELVRKAYAQCKETRHEAAGR